MKPCKWCGVVQPLSDFYRHKDMADGHLNKCKACFSKHDRDRYRANPERKKAYAKAYVEANRDVVLAKKREYNKRTAKRSAPYFKKYREDRPGLTAEQSRRRRAVIRGRFVSDTPLEALRQKLDMYGWMCVYCGSDLAAGLHWDHWKPLAKGGPHMLANLYPSCPECNLTKSSRWPYKAPRNYARGAADGGVDW